VPDDGELLVRVVEQCKIDVKDGMPFFATNKCDLILPLGTALEFPTGSNIKTAKVICRLMPSSSSNFVGRADYLIMLEAVFSEARIQADSRPVSVLSGLGGMGKTQISAKFAETKSHL
jgi:hypothetical protein